ncbi:cytochrome c [Thiohalophilus sp.]|jgi:sulfide dehydrogenase cytochrome subunit|uniref:c-type cytochrome n=1 Tax=Thiohalophilus sp. TaxID=3028392 RepID=UPI002ACEC694|nr:cytochrome c [Thiohalophilus sp.]MDZ7804719.1 cytochrome c [Thiohalophilus sp.]
MPRFSLPATLLSGVIALFISTTAPGAEISQGAMLSNSCAACHGTDGNSPGAMPTLNGKSADFIERALKGFRSGERDSTVMGRHASGYSDEEIAQIAEYFAGLK